VNCSACCTEDGIAKGLDPALLFARYDGAGAARAQRAAIVAYGGRLTQPAGGAEIDL
jgi:hypothetical protein